jgi:predicted DNA-binding transcriptional regulator AlpA
MPTAAEDQLELPLAGERYLRYDELKLHGIGFSRQHLANLEVRGLFPRRFKLSDRAVAWKLSEIRDWINSRSHG